LAWQIQVRHLGVEQPPAVHANAHTAQVPQGKHHALGEQLLAILLEHTQGFEVFVHLVIEGEHVAQGAVTVAGPEDLEHVLVGDAALGEVVTGSGLLVESAAIEFHHLTEQLVQLRGVRELVWSLCLRSPHRALRLEPVKAKRCVHAICVELTHLYCMLQYCQVLIDAFLPRGPV